MPGKVLVVRLSSLGDIVLTQPVLEALSKSGWEVDLLVHPDFASLARLLPGPKRVITSRVEAQKEYHWIVDLHGTGRARRMVSALRGRHVVHYHKRALARRLLVRPYGQRMFWNNWSGLKPVESVTQWYAEAVRPLGVSSVHQFPRLEIPEMVSHAAEQVLSGQGLSGDRRFAIMAIGAKWAAKEWPLDNFIQVARELAAKHGLVPVLVGSHAERLRCDEAAKACGQGAVSLAGRTNLSTLAGILSRAAVAITNDSGPMHMSLAAGTPTVALFGPTVPNFGFAPSLNPKAKIMAVDLPCRPCTLHGGQRCPLQHQHCLRLIEPSSVLDAAETIMDIKPKNRNQA